MSVESALHKIADALGMHHLHEEITPNYERPVAEEVPTDPNRVARERDAKPAPAPAPSAPVRQDDGFTTVNPTEEGDSNAAQ